ncbi:hypothetical protein U0070_001686 [Myodes glareolus]|uniref:Uncharacterized protein n=1 Tax=Myodes glareolus TaxID=447135 RepID=A0AAW0JC71_MYOGA
MLDLNTKIIIAVFSGMMTGTVMLLITAYFLVLRAAKEVKFANWGDVESSINSHKVSQEKIIRAKPITAVSSSILEGCDDYSIYTDSGILPPCFCVTNKEL